VASPSMRPGKPATPAAAKAPGRGAVGFLLVGVVIVVAIVAASVGVAMSSGGIPANLRHAAQSTLDLTGYSATVTVNTSQADDLGSSSPTPPAVRSAFVSRLDYQGSSAGVPATARLTTVTGHTTTTQTGTGSTVVTRTTSKVATVTSTRTVPDAASQVASTVTQYLHVILNASSAQGSGSTYHLAVPATAVPQPGLSAYARDHGQAELAVTLGGGYVRSIVVAVLSPPSSQSQTVAITPGV